jgi:hypothetical protein
MRRWGLTDALRLRIKDFKLEDLVRGHSFQSKSMSKAKQRLLNIERELASISESDASLFLQSEYKRIKTSANLVNWLRPRLRKDTYVVLNSKHGSPYNPSASILNRFLVFLLKERCQDAALQYRQGELNGEHIRLVDNEHGYQITLQGKACPERFHTIVLRQGPEKLINRLFPNQPVLSEAVDDLAR